LHSAPARGIIDWFYNEKEKSMNKKLAAIVGVVIAVAAAVWAFKPKAAANDSSRDGVFTLYYSPTCPHCHKARAFLAKVEKNYPGLRFEQLNTQTRAGADSYFKIRSALKIQQDGVPLAVFGDSEYILGFGDDSTTGVEYEKHFKAMQAKVAAAEAASASSAADSSSAKEPGSAARPDGAAGDKK
jgi:thiol-disulfide isomerase/thioredoxin